MNKLVMQITKLWESGKSELIDFDLLIAAYSKEKVDAVAIQLYKLQHATLLSYTGEEFGFLINLYDIDKLKNLPIVGER